jgi:putative membrane protein
MAILNADQHRIVSDAVAQAELSTSGEIVTILADSSDGYTDVALVWAIAVAFTAMSVYAVFADFYLGLFDDWLLGGWGHQWTRGEVLTLVIGGGLAKFIGMLLIQLWRPLRMFLIPGPIRQARVRNRAVDLFKVGTQSRTHGRTGVLIYLSMAEHRAEIVADEAIADQVPAEVWGAAMADMLIHIRKDCIGEGIAAGVRDVGAVLAEHFPRGTEDSNELPDRLIEV